MKLVAALFEQAELAIKTNDGPSAQNLIQELVTHSHTLQGKVRLASLYRRTGSSKVALQILRPIVIGYGRKLPASPVSAKIEYAANLMQLELLSEARRFLRLPEIRDLQEARKFHAMSFLHDYQLKRAAEEIEALLPTYSSDSYDYLVLQINQMVGLLADIHLPSTHKRFQKLARLTLQQIRQQSASRLLQAHQSLCLQAVFFAEEQKHLSVPSKTPENLLEYFQSFCAVFHEGRAGRIPFKAVKETYLELRTLAWKNHWFEEVREIDLHYSRVFQPELTAFVKMGTRYPHYQSRYLTTLTYPQTLCFKRELVSSEQILRPGFSIEKVPNTPKLKNLFSLLYREQYAPLSSLALWEVLAPEEHFIEPHSSNRVHQWVKRLKTWLKDEGIPAEILFLKQGYRLVPKTILSCPNHLLEITDPETEWKNKMKEKFAGGVFSVQDLLYFSSEFKIRELQNRLKNLILSSELEKFGSARRTRYRFKV